MGMEAWQYHGVSLLECCTRRMLERESRAGCAALGRGAAPGAPGQQLQPCSVEQPRLLSPCSPQRARASRAALHIPALPEMCLGSTGVCLLWFSNYVRQQQSCGELYRAGVLHREEMGDLSCPGHLCTILTRSCLCRLPRNPTGVHQRGGVCSGAGTLPPWTAAQIVPYFINRPCHLSIQPTTSSPGVLRGCRREKWKDHIKKSLHELKTSTLIMILSLWYLVPNPSSVRVHTGQGWEL